MCLFLQALGNHLESFLMRGINIGKDYLIHIPEANITPLRDDLMRSWVNASVRPKLCASFFTTDPRAGKAFLTNHRECDSGRSLQHFCRQSQGELFRDGVI